MKYFYIIMTSILVVLLGISSRRAQAMPPNCSGFNDSPQTRKLCAALAQALYGLPNGLDAYSEEIRPNAGYGLPASYKGRLTATEFLENNLPFVDRGTKRQDVDHVFLRFGKRR